MAGRLRFSLLTPRGEACACACDAVDLTAKDDAGGSGGGSIGIRRGHLPAVVALEEGGSLQVRLEGKVLYSVRIRGGFARIDREEVTVLTPELLERDRD